MNEKQQQLTFEKGITTIPSDAICSDNALEYANNLIYRDGEHHVIQMPTHVPGTMNKAKLLFVHKLPNNTENKIYEKDNKLYFGDNGNVIMGSEHSADIKNNQITSIGKTLSVLKDGRLVHFLWTGNNYNPIGEIPNLEIRPTLRMDGNDLWVKTTGNHGGAIEVMLNKGFRVVSDKQNEYNDLVIGLYNEGLSKIKQKNRFAKPFLVRAALEMYDGTYTQITNPIILWPTINGSTVCDMYGGEFWVMTPSAELLVSQTTDYSEFSDIIKDVVIFVSDGINVYDTTVDQKVITPYVTEGGVDHYHDRWNTRFDVKGVYLKSSTSNESAKMTCVNISKPPFAEGAYSYGLTKRTRKEIVLDLGSQSTFYKIFSLGIRKTGNESNGFAINVSSEMRAHTLENLTTQEQLDHDDYYSRCPLSCDVLYVYNSRLNVAGLRRGFFNGFNCFMPLEWSDGIKEYDVYVTINTNEGEKRFLHHNFKSLDIIKDYYYYPDPRASHVKIYAGSNHTLLLDVDLKEHIGLNGAYYFNESFNGSQPSLSTSGTLPNDSDIYNEPESLYGQLVQSQVNNPFTFLAEGYHNVGTGKILGMAALTQALSQGQFGQYPLVVFTTDGIWALSVNSEGIYTSAHPMSREVALESNPCITQTDGAVFFVSKKGLMLVVGNEVKCVSEQVNGRKGAIDIKEFITNSAIAYDYRDSLLWIFATGWPGSETLVYSIKTGTFAWCNYFNNDSIDNVVNNYPDYLIQTRREKHLYSLLNRPSVNEDTMPYSASLTSRPMKLENAMALKTILQVRHIHDIANFCNGTLTLSIKASNNLKPDDGTWVTLKSLGGTPWKYYKFAYNFNNLKATDTFCGSVIITQERRTNRLR